MPQENKRRLLRVLVLFTVLAALAVLLLYLSPPCLIRQATGLQCPGCGTQRMLFHLLRLDFSGAFLENPYMFFLLPFAGLYLIWESCRYVQKKRPLYRDRRCQLLWLLLLLLGLVFSILRNLL